MQALPRLLFITQEGLPVTVIQQVEEACQYGIQWIQLRLKSGTPAAKLTMAQTARSITRQHQVLLSINDDPELALEVAADGVHLGQQDMPVKQARASLPRHMIIGGSSNTLLQARQLYLDGADYAGIGPLRFTRTKENLNPILGPEAITAVAHQLQEEHHLFPLFGIGGIVAADIAPLLQGGLYGVAVSSAISQAPDRPGAIRHFLQVTNL